jgi:hypothetical protein
MSRDFTTVIHSTEVAKATGNTVTTNENVYTVPNGRTLRLANFSGGHEYTAREARVELRWRVGQNDTLIAVGYGMFHIPVIRDFIGNGANALVVRHINGDTAGALHMTGTWEGVLL